MKTLRVCNKNFNKKHKVALPHELLEKGLELVKRTGGGCCKRAHNIWAQGTGHGSA